MRVVHGDFKTGCVSVVKGFSRCQKRVVQCGCDLVGWRGMGSENLQCGCFVFVQTWFVGGAVAG
jgi:hypothetical protein